MKKCVRLFFIFSMISTLPLLSYAGQQEASKSSGITTLAKELVEQLVREDFSGAAKNFDDTMKGVMLPEKLQQVWKAVLTQAGAFKKQTGARTERLQQFDIVFVTCEFEKVTVDVKVVFNGERQIAGLFFQPAASSGSNSYKPPAYARPDSFREKDVTVGSGEWALPATLTLPSGEGPFPAVVLVHGSGPNDRDETLGPNKPFRDLAWGLATKGIAVLRYDKRTKAHRAKMIALKDSITVKEETVDDALEAVSLLRKSAGVDAKRIFVLGHSLGATLIPRIGKRDSNIAGFIALAGTTRPLEDVILYQTDYLAMLDGTLSDVEKTNIETVKQAVAKIKDPALSATGEQILGVPPSYWLDLRGYSPPEMARDLKQPMLILQGERDYQVTMEDFQGWKALATKKNVQLKTYPKLNHLFIEGEGKSTPAEYSNPGNVAEYVVSDIAGWIMKQ